MRKISLRSLVVLFLLSCLLHVSPVAADDMTFDSFEAAEAAAKKRADDYQQRMQEHIKSINEDWEKQQKDLGSDSSSPDITKITTRADGQKTSDTDAGKSLEDAVNSSVNKMKDEMISKATPGSTGFAGGAAGYQWSVKFKNGKYVLSDSYNEAEFNTGKKKEVAAPASPPDPESDATGQNEAAVAKTTPDDDAPDSTDPKSGTVATTPDSSPDSPATPSTKTASSKPSDSSGASSAPAKPAAPTEEPPKPTAGVDPAPVKLPPPSVRMVIQHPTEFSEEVFASNATSETTANYKLDKFKIPEDTRIKISVEVGDDVSPEDVSMVITDDQGDTPPISSAKLKNFRHMFRVPSEDKYSASVFVTDKKTPGNQQKKILQVMIPVSKVDFESRTIDNQRGSKSGGSSASMSSSGTSASTGSGNVDHSGFGRAQQVDLSDLYSDAGSGAPSTVGGGADSSSSTSGGSDSSDGSAAYSSASGNHSDSSGASDNGADSDSSYDNSEATTGASANGSSQAYASDSDPQASYQGNDSAAGNPSENGSAEPGTSETGEITDPAVGGSSSDRSSTNSNGYENNSSANSSAGGDENADSSGSYQSTDPRASDNDPENSNNDSAEITTRGGTGDGADVPADSDAQAKDSGDKSGLPAPDEEDPFIIGLSLKAEAQKVYQSFDFIDGTSQTSASIKAGGEVAFSLSLGANVEPESVLIKVSDGSQEIRGNLKRMGESFVYVFPVPTDKAFIEVTGKTQSRSFNYRVGIPIK
ncbi:MAG: hypothetical protein PHD82_16195 [Candidatus Riflebacteria bacterium]|nr:hypothetical protein [Candidatus Riflebacteria bacterium]